jgi:hypothetical protein
VVVNVKPKTIQEKLSKFKLEAEPVKTTEAASGNVLKRIAPNQALTLAISDYGNFGNF